MRRMRILIALLLVGVFMALASQTSAGESRIRRETHWLNHGLTSLETYWDINPPPSNGTGLESKIRWADHRLAHLERMLGLSETRLIGGSVARPQVVARLWDRFGAVMAASS